MKTYTKEQLDKIIDNHKLWLSSGGEKGERADLCYADLRSADLSSADLRSADLRSANLRSADLRSANLDYSAFPLWCGALDVHIDDRQARQLIYHIVRNVKYSKNTSAELKRICKIKSLVKQANKFHRIKECGNIEGASDE